MMVRIAARLVMVLALFAAFGCTSKTPTKLCGNFRSYETVADVRADLKESGVGTAWKEETKGTSPSDRRPPYELVYLSGPFRVSGMDGLLKLTFYNGSLMEAQFTPADSKNYIATVQREYSRVPQQAGQEITIDRRTKFRFDSLASGNLVFTWYDPQLENQWKKWVAANS
jgi:hypothetical protein